MAPLRSRYTKALLTLISSFAVCGPIAAEAASKEADRCAAMKLRAAGLEARDRLKCEKRGLASGADPSCVSKAQERRAFAFARTEDRGGCATEDDSGDIGHEVSVLATVVLEDLRPGGPAASQCTAQQLGAIGRALRAGTNAYARDKRSPDPAQLAADLSNVRSAFAAAFANAVGRGDCLSDSTSDQAYATVEVVLARFVGKLTPVCGDDVMAPGEECDGTETFLCGGPCAQDCTCVIPPACPCWDRDSLNEAFPPGFFDQDGRGGMLCYSAPPQIIASIATAKSCHVAGPRLDSYDLPRAGIGLLDGVCVVVTSDLDPSSSGYCHGVPPVIHDLTEAQTDACYEEILRSKLHLQCILGEQ